MNIDIKMLQTNSAIHKKIIYHDQLRFIPRMQGWFNIHQSSIILYHIN